jgi:hypothetical protein
LIAHPSARCHKSARFGRLFQDRRPETAQDPHRVKQSGPPRRGRPA